MNFSFLAQIHKKHWEVTKGIFSLVIWPGPEIDVFGAFSWEGVKRILPDAQIQFHKLTKSSVISPIKLDMDSGTVPVSSLPFSKRKKKSKNASVQKLKLTRSMLISEVSCPMKLGIVPVRTLRASKKFII